MEKKTPAIPLVFRQFWKILPVFPCFSDPPLLPQIHHNFVVPGHFCETFGLIVQGWLTRPAEYFNENDSENQNRRTFAHKSQQWLNGLLHSRNAGRLSRLN